MTLKNASFALLLCGGLLLMGSAVQAESVKTPVNKISPDGVGEEIGFITFSDADGGGVDIIVDLTGLPEGEHCMKTLPARLLKRTAKWWRAWPPADITTP